MLSGSSSQPRTELRRKRCYRTEVDPGLKYVPGAVFSGASMYAGLRRSSDRMAIS